MKIKRKAGIKIERPPDQRNNRDIAFRFIEGRWATSHQLKARWLLKYFTKTTFMCRRV